MQALPVQGLSQPATIRCVFMLGGVCLSVYLSSAHLSLARKTVCYMKCSPPLPFSLCLFGVVNGSRRFFRPPPPTPSSQASRKNNDNSLWEYLKVYICSICLTDMLSILYYMCVFKNKAKKSFFFFKYYCYYTVL